MIEVDRRRVRSKARVTDHGKVFTGEREINAILDLVKQGTEHADLRFLELACGTGNFLAEFFRQKLVITGEQYSGNWIRKQHLFFYSRRVSEGCWIQL